MNKQSAGQSLNPYRSPEPTDEALPKERIRPSLLRTVFPAAVMGGITTVAVAATLDHFATFGDSSLMITFFGSQSAGLLVAIAIWVFLHVRAENGRLQTKNLLLASMVAIAASPIAWFAGLLMFAPLAELAGLLPEIAGGILFVPAIALLAASTFAAQLLAGHFVLVATAPVHRSDSTSGNSSE